MLTIGQLADYVGVTQRAIRHYHRLGLLPEPGRDHSGYRRYDGQAVVDLTRIRTLAEAGVPLSRVKELQDAPPDETRAALDEIDHELGRRIRDLQGTRRRLRRLASGDPLDPAVQAYLDKVRTLGVSERMVRLERDGWVLMQVLYPQLVSHWLRISVDQLDDPQFRDLYLVTDEMYDWPPDDPTIREVAVRNVDYLQRQGWLEADQVEVEHDPAAYALVRSFNADGRPPGRPWRWRSRRSWTAAASPDLSQVVTFARLRTPGRCDYLR